MKRETKQRRIFVEGDGPIAKAIWDAKRHLDVSWDDLAKEIGLDDITLTRLGAGVQEVSVPVVQTLARYFRWTLDEVGQAVLYEPKKVKERRIRAQERRKLVETARKSVLAMLEEGGNGART